MEDDNSWFDGGDGWRLCWWLGNDLIGDIDDYVGDDDDNVGDSDNYVANDDLIAGIIGKIL